MKTSRYIGSAVVIAVFLFGAGSAFAQTVSGVSGSFSVGAAPTAGAAGASIGTLTLTGTGNGPFMVSSIPLTLTAGGGGTAANLSNCQLVNGAGTTLNTGGNVPAISATGATNFAFDTPLSVSVGSPVALTLRCNVATSTPSGATFGFSAGMPVFTSLAGSLTASLSVAPSVPAGSENVVLATVTLTAPSGGQSVTVSSIPITATFNGVPPANFTSCSIQNALALGIPLSSVTALGQSGSTFGLSVPTVVATNSTVRLALVCSVGFASPPGSSATFSVTPASIPATVNGVPITPTGAGSTAGVVSITAPVGAGTGTGPIPSVPNTGIGSDALATLLILALSLLAAYVGAIVARRMKTPNGSDQ